MHKLARIFHNYRIKVSERHLKKFNFGEEKKVIINKSASDLKVPALRLSARLLKYKIFISVTESTRCK